jgi:hypothetical protein
MNIPKNKVCSVVCITPVTNMATMRDVEVKSDKFNVV